LGDGVCGEVGTSFKKGGRDKLDMLFEISRIAWPPGGKPQKEVKKSALKFDQPDG